MFIEALNDPDPSYLSLATVPETDMIIPILEILTTNDDWSSEDNATDIIIPAHTPVTMQCTVTVQTPDLTYYFYKDGMDIQMMVSQDIYVYFIGSKVLKKTIYILFG